jgi:chromosome segregation ATPase
MAQLIALSVGHGNQDSAAKSFAARKNQLAEEKTAREKAQANVDTLAWAVEELKNTTDRFTAQVLTLEEKVKHLDNEVLDSLTKLRAKELSLEQTTKVNIDYKSQNARLMKKLESKYSLLVSHGSYALINFLITPFQRHRN